MIWIAYAAGWLVGSASLYIYMVLSAKEPRNPQCVECHLSQCDECPYRSEPADIAAQRAA